MTDPAILFVKPGAVSAADKTALHDAGVVVVEVENPHDVKLVRASATIAGDAMFSALLGAVVEEGEYENYGKLRTRFLKRLAALYPEQAAPGK